MASEKEDIQSDPPPNYGTTDTDKILDTGNDKTWETEEEKSCNRKKLIHGMLLSALYSVTVALSVPCLQFLGPVSLSSMELLFLAYAAHVVCSIPVCLLCWRRLTTLVAGESWWLLLAAILTGTSLAFFYLSSAVLPSGVVGAIEEGSFLIFSILLTWILDRRVRVIMLLAAGSCLVGLILFAISSVVIDPVRHQNRQQAMSPERHSGYDISRAILYTFHPAMSYLLLGLSAILLVIANLILNRRLSGCSLIKVLLFFPLIGLSTSLIILYCFTQPKWTFDIITPDRYLPFTGFIILFVISVTSLYAAWTRTPAPVFGLISAGSIVLYLILHYTIPIPGIYAGTPDVLEFLGAFLIILANVIGPLSELGLCPGQHLFE